LVTNQQLYLAIGIPLLFNATLVGVLMAFVHAKFQAVESKFEGQFGSIDGRFGAIEARLESIDRRFDDMRDLWRAELHRVEEVLDARLKHIEERR